MAQIYLEVSSTFLPNIYATVSQVYHSHFREKHYFALKAKIFSAQFNFSRKLWQLDWSTGSFLYSISFRIFNKKPAYLSSSQRGQKLSQPQHLRHWAALKVYQNKCPLATSKFPFVTSTTKLKSIFPPQHPVSYQTFLYKYGESFLPFAQPFLPTQ